MRAFEHFLVLVFRNQDLTPEQHKAFDEGTAVVGLCAVLAIPQTHPEGFVADRGNEGNLILKSFLLAQQGDDFRF